MAILDGTKANSSKNTMLNEPERAAEEEVEEAMITEPFSSSTRPLFHSTTPCCNHIGRFSYANCNLPRIPRAVSPRLARTAIDCAS